MNVADVVRTVYEYNRWGYGRVLDRVAELTPERLNTPGTAGHGSIRETFVHALNAQRGWLAFWDGTNPSFGRIATSAGGTGLKAEDLPDAAALRKAWLAIDTKHPGVHIEAGRRRDGSGIHKATAGAAGPDAHALADDASRGQSRNAASQRDRGDADRIASSGPARSLSDNSSNRVG